MTPVRFGRPAATHDAGSPAEAQVLATGAHPSRQATPPAAVENSPPAGHPSTFWDLAGHPSRTPRQERVDEAIDSWCGRLLELGGESALADITQLGSASIDLTAAHPSGVAQLFAGRQTLLSNLVRETASLAAARRRARTVLARADELAQRYGVAPTYLAIGIATWTALVPRHDEPEGADGAAATTPGDPAGSAGPAGAAGSDAPAVPVALSDGIEVPAGMIRRTVKAPILLRPIQLHARSESDVDLVLEPSVEVNPVLVRALRAAGSQLDVAEIARETLTEHGFAPRSALRRLKEEGEAALTNFRFGEHLVLGPFVHPGQVLVEDLEGRRRELARHDVVAALAGDSDALAAVRRPLPPFVAGDRPPGAERGVGDLDPSQQHALDAVASGANVFIDAPPGADVAGTLAGIVADAAAAGRHVLYVSGTRRAGQGLREAMAAVGLEDLLLDLSADSRWRATAGARLAGGAALPGVTLDEADIASTRTQLVEARARMSGYITALHAHRPAWGVSAYDALQSLAALTSPQASPRTAVRLDPATVRALVGDERRVAAEALTRAAELGAFTLRPEDTPWFNAALTDGETARRAIERVQRLASRTLPALRRRITDISMQAGLTRADRIRTWGEQLAMLQGVHTALDTFEPAIFERPVDQLVAATAHREWRQAHGIEMGFGLRRQLTRLAKELVRPGHAPNDLHRALLDVQAQRDVWARHTAIGGVPLVPEALPEALNEFVSLLEDLTALEPVLAGTPGGADLAGLPLADLEARVNALAEGAGALTDLPERTRILESVRALGLGELVDDLTERRVPADLVRGELELAWWSSVFEEILRADPALGGYDGDTLGALADRLRELDLAHLDTLSGPVLGAVAKQRREALVETTPATRELLRDLLQENVRDVAGGVAALGRLAGTLRPCWMVAPMQVPQLLNGCPDVDLVVLDAAQHLPVEQAVSAISRARQVVVVGDSRRAALDAEGAPPRIVDALASVLPGVTLSADRVVREPALMAFLGEHGYADVIRSVPTPQTHSALRLEVVDGFGMPSPGSAVVESPQSEVDRVVDLVIEHALTRPDESLVVLTVSLKHADRVREAVRAAIADSPAVRRFFAGKRTEPFAVLELDSAAGVRRDAVILSLGLGKTPHGRVMHRFGRISDPEGAGLIIDAIDACRRRLTVVSCFAPGELDRWRLRTPGPLLLADLLEAAEAGGALAATVPGEGEPDQLLVDLAERLSQLGLSVIPRYGVPGGVRIPLVLGHPALPDELFMAVLTDDADYVAQPSLRIRDRHDVQRLADRGWGVHMAFSTAVFLDPQREAEKILAAVRKLLAGRRLTSLEFTPVAPPASLRGASSGAAGGSAGAAVPAAAAAADAAPGVDAPAVDGVELTPGDSATPGGSATPDDSASQATDGASQATGDLPPQPVPGEGEGEAGAERTVEEELSAMTAQYAAMEAALWEMEAEFDDVPDESPFAPAPAGTDSRPLPDGSVGFSVDGSADGSAYGSPADLAASEPVSVPVLDEDSFESGSEDEVLDVAGIDLEAAAAQAAAVRAAAEAAQDASGTLLEGTRLDGTTDSGDAGDAARDERV